MRNICLSLWLYHQSPCTPEQNRTVTIITDNKILSLARLPISPPGYFCSPSWNRTTNISLEVRSYIHLTNRPTKHNHFTSASVKDCRANCIYNLIVFADRTGLEPATSAVTGQHSNQLNYLSKLHYRSLTNFYFLLVNFCSNLSNLESN